jgi:hypothetical protein
MLRISDAIKLVQRPCAVARVSTDHGYSTLKQIQSFDTQVHIVNGVIGGEDDGSEG